MPWIKALILTDTEKINKKCTILIGSSFITDEILSECGDGIYYGRVGNQYWFEFQNT